MALRLVILSFSVDSQWEKATPEFLEGGKGGAPLECPEESDCKNSEIFFKLTDTTEGLADNYTGIKR